MIALARDIAMFRPTLEAFVRGEPAALLLVEFAEAEWEENARRLARLHELIGDLGFAWDMTATIGAAWSTCSIRSCRPRSRSFAPPASTS